MSSIRSSIGSYQAVRIHERVLLRVVLVATSVCVLFVLCLVGLTQKLLALVVRYAFPWNGCGCCTPDGSRRFRFALCERCWMVVGSQSIVSLELTAVPCARREAIPLHAVASHGFLFCVW